MHMFVPYLVAPVLVLATPATGRVPERAMASATTVEPSESYEALIAEAEAQREVGDHARAATLYTRAYHARPEADRADDLGLFIVKNALADYRIALAREPASAEERSELRALLEQETALIDEIIRARRLGELPPFIVDAEREVEEQMTAWGDAPARPETKPEAGDTSVPPPSVDPLALPPSYDQELERSDAPKLRRRPRRCSASSQCRPGDLCDRHGFCGPASTTYDPARTRRAGLIIVAAGGSGLALGSVLFAVGFSQFEFGVIGAGAITGAVSLPVLVTGGIVAAVGAVRVKQRQRLHEVARHRLSLTSISFSSRSLGLAWRF